jgi:hypothetical protein
MSARDWAAEMFGDAISDLRAKLVSEGWFGRRVPEPGGQDLGWLRQPEVTAPAVHAPEPAHQPALHEQDRGIDR